MVKVKMICIYCLQMATVENTDVLRTLEKYNTHFGCPVRKLGEMHRFRICLPKFDSRSIMFMSAKERIKKKLKLEDTEKVI